MSLVLVTTDRYADHLTPPGHPERVERAEVMQVVASRWEARGGVIVEPRPATRAELARVHADHYLDAVAKTAGRAVSLDPDTFTSPESHEVALLAAGAALVAVETVLRDSDGPGAPTAAFALVRPPGHHAERARAMGFCLYNNIAAAAAHALALGVPRVAIVDYDVHHGNGTQGIFYEDPRVLFLSTHQHPFYPGTGAATEAGRGGGEGFTFNVPLEAGATDEDYRLVFDRLVLPVLHQFGPDLVLVSAGYDAHERDPLGGMRVTTQGYATLTRDLREVAKDCCGGRIVLVTEGGYDLKAFAACLEASIAALEDEKGGGRTDTAAPPREPLAPRGRAAVDAVRGVQKRFWAGI